jgi:hypothetical protein
MDLLTRVKTLLGSKTQDNEGWVRQGKFTPVKNLRDMAADSEGWFQQGKFTPGRQISSQINYQKQNSPINRALYTGLETASRPVVNSLANIGALGATGLGSLQMAFNKPQAAQKSFDKALAARQFAGTQDTGWNTIKKGGIDALQTYLTGKGLKYTTPVNLGISGLLGGTMSKLSGGDFATGFGKSAGTTPSIMGAVGLTNPLLAKIMPAKASPLVSRLTGGLLNVSQGIGINASQGMPNTAGSIGLDLVTGIAGGKGQFDMGTNFSMPRNTMDEVIQAEDKLLHPERYLEKTISVTKKNANSIRNVQIKKIQEEAASVIDRISGKYLPNDVLQQTAGNVKAQIKALVDLSAQNKLANVNYLTDKKVNTPEVKGKYKTINQGGVIKEVEGKPVDIHKELSTILNKDENGNWVVTETTTGRALSGGGFPSESQAIRYTNDLINSLGIDKVKQRISELPPIKTGTPEVGGIDLQNYNKVFHQTSPENASLIEKGGFNLKKVGSGANDPLPSGVNTKLTNNELNIQGKGKQMELYYPKNAKIKEFNTRQEAEQFFYQNSPEYKKAMDEMTRIDNEFNSKYGSQIWARPDADKLLNQWKNLDDQQLKIAKQASTKISKDLGLDVIKINSDTTGVGKNATDNTIILNPSIIKINSLSPIKTGGETIKIKPSEKIKISALESKPSKPQLSEQSQTLVKQNLDQPRTSLNTQTGQMKNSVPSSVVEGTPSKVSQPIIPQKKYLESVNTTKLKLKPEEKKTLETATNLVKDEIQKVKGKTLSNDEVIKVAKESDILQKVITRDQTLEAEAIQLKARQQMVSLDKEVNELSKQGNSPLLQKKIQELLESIKTVNANAADKGRQLQALSIDAGDESVRLSILKDISKIETDTEKIIRESANVDWNNANKVAEFYRKFIKPSTMETLDEYRYNNMLSSPRTHIRNAFSNLVQTFVTRPATLAAQGKFKQTGQYYVGAIKSLPDAVSEFTKAFKGETPIGQQDIKNIPTGKIPKFMTIPSKALEASDRFFTKLISSGEMARGASEKEALDTAAYSLFRQGLNPEGQGKLLNAIDSLTSWTYNAPKAVRWFVPFIRTPMNFAKQWVEYSPLGFLTTIGAKNKGEQIAKAFIGSTIMAVGAKFALDNNTTWSAPTDPKEKEIFYASGRKPFSVKIGDKWVSMMYAGPFALAFAVPAAAKYYQEDNRTALTDTQLEKLGRISMSMAEYLSGQTFLEGMNNFVKFFSGDADYTFAKNMGYTAGQVIPLQGLVRWVSGIIDPVYRKATTFGDQIKSGIPGVSKTLPPYLDPTGEPSTREGYNSFTPYDITPNKSEYNKPLEERQDKLQQNAVINKTVKEMESQLQSGTDPKPVQVGNIFILPEDGEIKKIELKQFSLPKKTGDVEKDKKALSSYKSSITAQIKQVDRLIAAGAMPADQGNELKANLNDLKNQASTVSVSSGGKKSTKSKGGKISLKKSTIKISKLPTFKAPSFGKLGTTSYKTIARPNIKLSKPKTIVVAPKKKSNTIKIKPMPTMKVAKGGFLG